MLTHELAIAVLLGLTLCFTNVVFVPPIIIIIVLSVSVVADFFHFVLFPSTESIQQRYDGGGEELQNNCCINFIK